MAQEIDKTDLYKFIISRYDGYYESVNQKGNYLIALNTLVIGIATLVLQNLEKLNLEGSKIGVIIIFGVLLLFSFASIIFVLIATRPYWGKKEDIGDSVLFFGSVSGKTLDNYKRKLSELDALTLESDYSSQIHDLAKGLSHKYDCIKWANDLLMLSVITFIIMVIVIFSIA